MTSLPFREEELETRLASLRRSLEACHDDLKKVRSELRKRRPWSWLRFALGVVLPILLGVGATMATAGRW
jgi:hypothetical protein